jgi:hypothetical protein
VILDCEPRCDPDSEDGDGNRHQEVRLERDQTIEGDLRALFQRLCTDPNAGNAKMKKKLSVPGA